ncbi:MarR family transcriptional regulator [Flagellimonas taeanensis]|jgi:DNA-binding MarR family transcriptional regulator|uniref:DNA-binding transcriptional regulator, MarR family n=1 Tax=Flagellimonas taeanensis TaxID=1005926 RepID=A0A3A1NS16_9FLAO|nr:MULTISPECIES: MarR family transcriptional regulator [Allomuricauda]MDC6384415.1 MarR family transcriptional regulator [Muricauda sp. SK9]MEE1962496.1 MarR family transcriptional regulator [Allomuricauda taeanensis]RIV49763.1 MarR family transcriptional regulator [Allomuricauda taeanensis]RIV53962.1 MarR family transcriptional regulator [Allomuricauda taeanensis]SFC58381.1 DNA-binding transcriptional regulator, MarR family [Allomuricauda taeanensis]
MKVEEIIKTSQKLPLESRTLIHMTLVQNKNNEAFANALKPYGISMQQFNVLRILRGQQGKPANLSTLNERMVTKMSNTTRLVDKLLAKGYVDRSVCPSNRRKVEIIITQSGLESLSKMDKAVAEAEKNVVKNFSKEELEQLNHLLDKF